MTRRAFYLLAAGLCALGYAWVAFSGAVSEAGSPCLFRWLTGVPCPACGSTRALRVLLQGDVAQAFLINPNGIVLAVLLVGVPVGLLADAVRRRATLYVLFCRIDTTLRRRMWFVAGAVLVLLNWIWNIYKGI